MKLKTSLERYRSVKCEYSYEIRPDQRVTASVSVPSPSKIQKENIVNTIRWIIENTKDYKIILCE